MGKQSAFRIVTWPQLTQGLEISCRPLLIGVAAIETGIDGLPAGGREGVIHRQVDRGAGRVRVTCPATVVDRCGERLLEDLAVLTDAQHLNGSAAFFSTGSRDRCLLEHEYFLRRFVGLTPHGHVDFVREWGPLDLPHHPRDLWRDLCSQGNHLAQVEDLLSQAGAAFPNDGTVFVVGEGRSQIRVQGFVVEIQSLAFAVFQAVIGTLIELLLRDDRVWTMRYGFSTTDLSGPTPREVRSIWEERGLPVPDEMGEALDTTIGILARASTGSGPHLEVRSRDDGDAGFWMMGRGVLGALALQALRAASDSVPARACQRCGELFLRQDGQRHAWHTQASRRVRYCSDRCARASAQRAYSERRRRRAQDL